MTDNTVQRHINDNQYKISPAAYSLFKEWLASQEGTAQARQNMNRALDVAGKPFYKQYFQVNL